MKSEWQRHKSYSYPLHNTKEDVAFASNVNWTGFLGHDLADYSWVINLGCRGTSTYMMFMHCNLQEPHARTHCFFWLATNYFSL